MYQDDDDRGRDVSRSPRRSASPNDEFRRSRSPRERRRSGSDDGERYEPELRLMINTKDAGAVIGKGGANIKTLRQDFNVSITVADSRTPERVVIICGEVSTLNEVLYDIYKSIEEKHGSGGGRRDSDAKRDGDVTGKLLIHQSQAGCVIGRQGNQLREFRNTYSVDIKVFAQCCPRSTERVVQMIGKPANIAKCIVSIVKLLKTWLPKGRNISYNPDDYDPDLVRDYGGFYDENFRPSRDRYDRGSPPRGRDRDYGRDGGRSFGGSSRKTSQQVSIPSDLAGVIIGKGGQKIRQIRKDSGAEVDLNDAALPGDRIITLSGTPDQIQNAQYMLQTCVKRHLAANAK